MVLLALFVSAENAIPVHATPVITLNTTQGQAGVIIALTGSGFAIGPGDDGSYSHCPVTGTPVTTPVSACTFTGGGMSASFTVANVPNGVYSVQVTGSTGDSASILFTVVSSPTIALSLSSGPIGAIVTVTGSGFAPADSTGSCIVSGTAVQGTSVVCASGAFITPAGTLPAGVSFTVASVPPGTYTITVQSSIVGDQATQPFTVVGPSITLNPTVGISGTVVAITGSGFITTDSCATVTISSSPATLMSGNTCTTFTGGILTTASFTVGSPAPGTYTVTVTGSGSAGDFAQATFTVTGPSITLNPTVGTAGTVVAITGSGFITTDSCATVTISSSPATLMSGNTCTAFAGGILTTASFTVNTPATPGTYTVKVTGSGSAGDFATATFTVTGPSITLHPSSGPAATVGSITGSGFVSSDTCNSNSVTSSPLGLLTGATCAMSNGQITSATFTVSSTAPLGTYTITVCGSTAATCPATADFAQATFVVTPTSAQITLTPNSGPAGTVVAVLGSAFSSTDTSCTFSSSPGTSIITGTPTCTFSSGTFSTSFTVTPEPNPGIYTITVTGDQAHDSASATFTVTGPHITLTPGGAPPGTTITVTGGGFYTNDACPASPYFVSTPTNIITTPATCTMTNGQITSATFTVLSAATLGTYTVSLTGTHGDVATATFVVQSTSPSGFA